LLDVLSDKVWQNHSDAKIQKRLRSLYAKPSFDLLNLQADDNWQSAFEAIALLKS